MADILKNNRWANDQGKPDSNKPLDLKMEQVIKTNKKVLRGLGSNNQRQAAR